MNGRSALRLVFKSVVFVALFLAAYVLFSEAVARVAAAGYRGPWVKAAAAFLLSQALWLVYVIAWALSLAPRPGSIRRRYTIATLAAAFIALWWGATDSLTNNTLPRVASLIACLVVSSLVVQRFLLPRSSSSTPSAT
jgi:hypothetical protein